ncbi:hypothetical protein DFH09DRAFT_1176372 [Mycena vulgaris]|nr:hypothetical protein DFH09DRAFT_1176372 [Mycena vulgaris]
MAIPVLHDTTMLPIWNLACGLLVYLGLTLGHQRVFLWWDIQTVGDLNFGHSQSVGGRYFDLSYTLSVEYSYVK